jgi:hypothetical protein
LSSTVATATNLRRGPIQEPAGGAHGPAGGDDVVEKQDPPVFDERQQDHVPVEPEARDQRLHEPAGLRLRAHERVQGGRGDDDLVEQAPVEQLTRSSRSGSAVARRPLRL